MEKKKKSKNYWPYAIISIICLGVFACAWTIKIALDNPVEMDSFYLTKYQDVDRNINEIQKKQKEFSTYYDIEYGIENVNIGDEFYIPIQLKDKKTNLYLQDANITFMLSRPETNADNISIFKNKANEEKFIFGPFKVDKPGRWQVLTRIKIDNKEGFFSYEIFALK